MMNKIQRLSQNKLGQPLDFYPAHRIEKQSNFAMKKSLLNDRGAIQPQFALHGKSTPFRFGAFHAETISDHARLKLSKRILFIFYLFKI